METLFKVSESNRTYYRSYAPNDNHLIGLMGTQGEFEIGHIIDGRFWDKIDVPRVHVGSTDGKIFSHAIIAAISDEQLHLTHDRFAIIALVQTFDDKDGVAITPLFIPDVENPPSHSFQLLETVYARRFPQGEQQEQGEKE
jgi:hypothetical protein